jgi:hypothetical protein
MASERAAVIGFAGLAQPSPVPSVKEHGRHKMGSGDNATQGVGIEHLVCGDVAIRPEGYIHGRAVLHRFAAPDSFGIFF